MIDFSEIDPKSITEEDCIAELKAVQQVYPETFDYTGNVPKQHDAS